MKKAITSTATLILLGFLAVGLIACGEQNSAVVEPEQNEVAVEVSAEEYYEEIVKFNPADVNIVAIPSADVSPEILSEIIPKWGLEFYEISKSHEANHDSGFFTESQGIAVAMFIVNSLEHNLDAGNYGLKQRFHSAHRFAFIEFQVNGRLTSNGWTELLLNPESQAIFKDVVEVIEYAKTTGDNTHVYRLLDQAISMSDKTEFTNLLAAILIGYLASQELEADRNRAEDAANVIQEFYLSNLGR